MDTRTPRRPLLGGGSTGIDAGPGLNTVKVPSDPARLSSTQASFRLRLGTPVAPLIEAPAGLLSTGAAFGDPYATQGLIRRPLVTPQVVVPASAVPAFAGAGGAGAPRRKGRVTAVTWTGQAPPGTSRPPSCWTPSGSVACPRRPGSAGAAWATETRPATTPR